jgi:hypothetical protein
VRTVLLKDVGGEVSTAVSGNIDVSGDDLGSHWLIKLWSFVDVDWELLIQQKVAEVFGQYFVVCFHFGVVLVFGEWISLRLCSVARLSLCLFSMRRTPLHCASTLLHVGLEGFCRAVS